MSVWCSTKATRNAYVYEYEYEHGFASYDDMVELAGNERAHLFLDVAHTWGPLIRLCTGDHTYTVDVTNAKALRDGLTEAIKYVEDLPKYSRITSEDE